MIMRIGIDIDGTINNFSDVAAKYIEKEYGLVWDKSEYEIYKGLTKDQIHAFSKKYEGVLTDEIKPLDSSREVINELMLNRNQIFFITARGYDVAENTLYWLRQYGFNYTDILFACGDKVDACRFKRVDYMIDDAPHNLMALNKANVPYIVFDHEYNKDIYGEEFRAKTWDDMYNFFDFLGVDK